MRGSPTTTLRLRLPVWLAAAVLWTAAAASLLPAASPALSSIRPAGAQRGTEVEVAFNGARLGDALAILIYSPGIEVTHLEAAEKQVKAKLRIAPDCRPGEHAMRVRTATGISDLRTFFVGVLPTVDEKEPNNEFATPQKIALETTVHGVVENEDVDHYAFEAKKGQRISVEIEGLRLGNTIFDPYVAILDAKRFALAASDDTPLLRQDSACQAVAPEDGVYTVEVRDSAYGGNGNCLYRLHVGTFPRPHAVYPAGGKRGEKLEVTFIGDVAGDFTRSFDLLGDAVRSFGLLAEDEAGPAPSPNRFRLGDLDNILETEPNDKPQEATPGKAPAAFNGVIAAAGDVDFFKFAAKKGQVFDVHLYGRRLRSPLDSVVNVRILGGGGVAGNDDTGGPDSYFRFTAPEDKEYTVSVRDHLGKGGPDHVYRVEVAPVESRLSLSLPKVERYSQERQTIAVPRGGRYATLVAANRENFGGDLVLAAADLPAGVTLHAETMPSNLSSIPIVFEAAAGAAIDGALCRLIGRHADPEQKISGGFVQSVELVTGAPGQSVYWQHEVERLAVAVTEEAPYSIRIVEPQVPLVQSGAMDLKVTAERKEGFNEAIGIQMVFNPPGVGSARGASIPAGKNEGTIRINANGNAQIRVWKIAVNAVATVAGGPLWTSSQMANLEIAAPPFTIAAEKASVEQGKETEIFCTVEHARPFEGKASVRLLGLPHKVAAGEVEVTPETKEFAFKVKVDAASPPGNHKNVFCQVRITEKGEPIVHSTGGTELRIDKPLPPPKTPPPAPKVAVEKKAAEPQPAAPEPKRLTRLQKLRLQYKESQGGGS